MSTETKRQEQIDQYIGKTISQCDALVKELRRALQREMELEQEVSQIRKQLRQEKK